MNSSHCLNHLDQHEDVSVAASRQNARSTAFAQHIFCFSRANNIRNYTLSLAMREDRLQIQIWNKMIQRTTEGGLIGKWLRDLSNTTINDPVYLIRPINLRNFYRSFIFCLVPLFAAFCTLISELVVHHKLKNDNSHRFWRTMDWLIDGQRHKMKFPANPPKEREEPLLLTIQNFRSGNINPFPRLATARQPLSRELAS